MKTVQLKVSRLDSNKRIDVLLVAHRVLLSRSQIQKSIADGCVSVNGDIPKSSYRVREEDVIQVVIKDPVPIEAQPEDISIEIIFEDAWIAVVNKPAGMVVHPASGNYSGTLVNALLYHCRNLSGIGGAVRPGIVHRLDKGTTGVLVVAKNDEAHLSLSQQFKKHTITRKYTALVHGVMEQQEGTISAPIGRDPVERKKMSTRSRRARQAVTHWEVQEHFDDVSLVSARLETGRTHQVRVHLASTGHPIVGDRQYGAVKRIRAITSKRVHDAFKGLSRPLLHAHYLEFLHPGTKKPVSFSAPLPDDFLNVLTVLQEQTC